MYKIFVNQQVVCISDEVCDPTFVNVQHVKEEDIRKIAIEIKQGTLKDNICLTDIHPKRVFKKFRNHFQFIIAAGGVVFNHSGQFLAIFRLGKWDFPKGKLLDGETKKQAAKREVQEECGISGLEIVNKLPSTYHIFLDKKERWTLKRSYWYSMNYSGNEKLVPQVEENIIRCEWMSKDILPEFLSNSYLSINDLIISSLFFQSK